MNIDESQIYALAPFAATLGVTFPVLRPERVQAVLPTRRELSTLGGGLHGGAIMSVCDVASAVCVALNVGEGCVWTTAESTTYFLRSVRSTATATSTPLKVGRTLATIKTEVHDDEDDLLCAYTTQMVHISRPARVPTPRA
ncbi:PaaI family thioesterase [Mycolicibacterium sp. P1-18]|uniref:PaaI family thioesterase n=1 Tax=Mycolicibacterium sp. P1-18 TaxID=2024615 RepID=UPI0011F349FB|nr:PaaI family thioesterase [Mycolicibacterium sp. P1-18]KAA0092644.1 PaaI family thioesterase [Mycolicibacterium sp. P1-18]